MSILTDIPQRRRFEDMSERGAFHAWMRHAIIFAVIASLAALVLLYLTDSRREAKAQTPVQKKAPETLPVVADLPRGKPAKPVPPPVKKTAQPKRKTTPPR